MQGHNRNDPKTFFLRERECLPVLNGVGVGVGVGVGLVVVVGGTGTHILQGWSAHS